MKITFESNNQGGIILPNGVAELGFDAHIPLDICENDGQVVIESYQPACNICGGKEFLILLKEYRVSICENCFAAIQAARIESKYIIKKIRGHLTAALPVINLRVSLLVTFLNYAAIPIAVEAGSKHGF